MRIGIEELVLVTTPNRRGDTFEIQLLHIFFSFFLKSSIAFVTEVHSLSKSYIKL